MLESVFELYAYNRWANQRVLAAVAALDDEQFTRDLHSSFPSVRDTLAHMVGADWIWLQRWLGTSPTAGPPWDLGTLAAIRTRWDEVERERSLFLAGLTPTALERVLHYRTLKGDAFSNPLSELLRHVVNHATYHRGQVTTMLRQLGSPANSTDMIVFYRETQKQPLPE